MLMRFHDNASPLGSGLVWFRTLVISSKATWCLLLGPLAALVVLLLPADLEPVQQRTLAITVFMVVCWITEPIEHGLTALIGLYLFWALEVTSFSVAFSGFVNSTTWFIFASLLMAEAATRTGLANRIGFIVMNQMGSSFARLPAGLLTLSFLLTLFVPSGIGRVAILMAMTVGITKASGLAQTNFARGLFVVLTSMAALSDVMILSGATSMMTRAILEEYGGVHVLWSQWFLGFLPLTIAMIFCAVAVMRWMFPAQISDAPLSNGYFADRLKEMGPWSSAEKRALLWFVLALSLWATDFIHRINPAVVGIGIGLLMSLPRIGVLDGKAVRQNNFLVIVFSAGAIGMANVLTDTQLLPILTDSLIGWMRPLMSDVVSYTLTLYVGGFLYHFIFANRQSMLITSLPMLLGFGAAQGFDLLTIALLWTVGGGGGLFVYQSAIFVVGYSHGQFDAKDFFKFSAAITIIQGALLVLLVQFYWPLIGLNWLG